MSSKHSNHPPKHRTHPPTEAEKAEDLLGPEDSFIHAESETAPKPGPDPLEVETNVVAIPTELDEKTAPSPAADPAHPFEPAQDDGKVRIRVRSTHGMPRAGTIDGKTHFFGPQETDHTVTPDELAELRNDPILQIHDLVNGFTEAHRREANLNVERAQQALSDALAIRDRVNARAPAKNNVNVANLYEGGEMQSIAPTEDMIRPEDAPKTYHQVKGSPLPYLDDVAEDVGTPRPVETTHDYVTGKPMPKDTKGKNPVGQ